MLPRLLMVAILFTSAGSVHGQNLGEAAAREKERRAKSAGSAKSYADSDLRDAASKRAKEGGSASSEVLPGPPATPDSAVSPDSSASESEASKKVRGADYKARLAAVNAQLEHAEEALSAAEKDWHLVSTHPWQLVAASERVRSRLDAARKVVQRLRGQRDDLEDAARREGIPPGYLR